MKRILAFLPLAVWCRYSCAADMCDTSELEVCFSYDSPQLYSELREHLPSPDELSKHCNTVIKLIQCKAAYNHTCWRKQNGPSPPPYPLTLTNLRDLIVEVCNEKGDIGKGYRKNVACFNSILEPIAVVGNKFIYDMQGFLKFLQQEDREFDVNRSSEFYCLVISNGAKRIGEIIEESCGTGARMTLDQLVESFLDECPPPEKMAPLEEKFEIYISQPVTTTTEKQLHFETLAEFDISGSGSGSGWGTDYDTEPGDSYFDEEEDSVHVFG